MPITPFIGLSVLIHIMIIVGNKLFRFTPKNEKSIATSTMMHYAGFLIVIFIFGVILTGATLITHASIEDGHSSIRFVSRTAASAYAMVFETHQPPTSIENSYAMTMAANVPSQTDDDVTNENKLPQVVIAPIKTDEYATENESLETAKIALLETYVKLTLKGKPGQGSLSLP